MSPAGSRRYGVADIDRCNVQRRAETYDSGGLRLLITVTSQVPPDICAGFSSARLSLTPCFFPNDLGD